MKAYQKERLRNRLFFLLVFAIVIGLPVGIGVYIYVTTGELPTRCDYMLEPDWYTGCK